MTSGQCSALDLVRTWLAVGLIVSVSSSWFTSRASVWNTGLNWVLKVTSCTIVERISLKIERSFSSVGRLAERKSGFHGSGPKVLGNY